MKTTISLLMVLLMIMATVTTIPLTVDAEEGVSLKDINNENTNLLNAVTNIASVKEAELDVVLGYLIVLLKNIGDGLSVN